MCHFKNGTFRDADVRRSEDFEVHTDELAQHLGHPPRLWCDMTKDRDGYYYPDDVLLFPVNIDKNGNETRLECPRMSDEIVIEEWRREGDPPEVVRRSKIEASDGMFRWHLEYSGEALTHGTKPPSKDHYPRKVLEGFWVWSTRR